VACLIVLVGTPLVLLFVVFIVRPWIPWQNAPTVTEVTKVTKVTACPHCQEKPPKVRFRNRCSGCGCEYDRLGKILGNPKTPAQLKALNRARLSALEDEVSVRRFVTEWKELDHARFNAIDHKPHNDDQHYQPGSDQGLTS